MEITIISGNDVDKINTRDFENFDDLYNSVLNSIKTVWNYANRKSGNALIINRRTMTIHIGTNMNNCRNLVEWRFIDAKVGGTLYDGKIMCASAWHSIVDFIRKCFALQRFKQINDMEFEIFENDAMAELNNKIETAQNTIKAAEEKINREIEYGSMDSDVIGNAAQDTFDALLSVKVAVHDFLKKMSDYTNCDFIMADAYGELFFETDKLHVNLLEDIDVEGEFFNWLTDMFKSCADGENFANTLYQYIAVA